MEHSSDVEMEEPLNEEEKDEILQRLLIEVRELRESNEGIKKELKKVKKIRRSCGEKE